MPDTYLRVPFAQKDRVKALGARWDAVQKMWFVPGGIELAPFSAWLPSSTHMLGGLPPNSLAAEPTDSTTLATGSEKKGVSLSQLLAGVERTVAQAYREGVWTRVDVVNVTIRNRHVYLELSERDEDGVVVAQVRAAIWARAADRVVPEFERASGAQLAPGIKLLVLAKPVFKAQYGLSLEITAIDASYTVGDLEAQKRRIREQLKAERLYERNRQLAPPWDFTRVLVVSPQGAAGLGDFSAEADRLHRARVCEFIYVHSRFQGPGAPAEILQALRLAFEGQGNAPLDALIVIRGGGAVNDLAWLNDYELAKFLCLCPVPVLTGIGHERDSTVLDEVAHRSFDTPSKVIVAVEKLIAMRASDARQTYEQVIARSVRAIERAKVASERLDAGVRTSARATLVNARTAAASAINQLQIAGIEQLHKAHRLSELKVQQVHNQAKQLVRLARHEVPSRMSSVSALAAARVRSVEAQLDTRMGSVFAQSANQARHAGQDLQGTSRIMFERAQQTVRRARSASEALVREVAGQGPQKTLARGFALVHASSGKTVTDARSAMEAGVVRVTFKDGVVQAEVQLDEACAKKDDQNGQ